MKNLPILLRNIIFFISKLEKNHKILTYSSLLFLKISAYFIRLSSEKVKIELATLEVQNSGIKENKDTLIYGMVKGTIYKLDE